MSNLNEEFEKKYSEKPQRPLNDIETQILGLISENKSKYPEASAWILEMLIKEDTSGLVSEEEMAWLIMQGYSEERVCHDEYISRMPRDIRENKVKMIKWYRNEAGVGLVEAKNKIEEYLASPKRRVIRGI